jgi:hypothetical protein
MVSVLWGTPLLFVLSLSRCTSQLVLRGNKLNERVNNASVEQMNKHITISYSVTHGDLA